MWQHPIPTQNKSFFSVIFLIEKGNLQQNTLFSKNHVTFLQCFAKKKLFPIPLHPNFYVSKVLCTSVLVMPMV